MSLNAASSDPKLNPFNDFFQDTVSRLLATEGTRLPPGVDAQITGISAMLGGIQSSVERDFAIVDGVVLPLSLIFLAVLIRSFRLLLPALFAIGAATSISFALMYVVANYVMDVVQFAPSVRITPCARTHA